MFSGSVLIWFIIMCARKLTILALSW